MNWDESATDWDAYATKQPHSREAYAAEPVQLKRLECIARRCVGTVLDVGSSDGYGSSLVRGLGHTVTVLDIAFRRMERASLHYGLPGLVADASALPFPDRSFDTVVLGEILEHMDNPGSAFAEASRVARERVIVSVPLRGWVDPTHQWRISLDQLHDAEAEPTKTDQIVLTWQRGACWPPDYADTDPTWKEQFS